MDNAFFYIRILWYYINANSLTLYYNTFCCKPQLFDENATKSVKKENCWNHCLDDYALFNKFSSIPPVWWWDKN